MVEICWHGENEIARVAAASAILDGGRGKAAVPGRGSDVPTQITLNFGTPLRPPAEIADATPATDEDADPFTMARLPAPDDGQC